MIPQCDISAEFYIFIFFFLKQKLNRFYSLPRERISVSKGKRENELKIHSIIFLHFGCHMEVLFTLSCVRVYSWTF